MYIKYKLILYIGFFHIILFYIEISIIQNILYVI